MTIKAMQSILALETGEVFLFLIKLHNDNWGGDLFFVNNLESIVSGGDVYKPADIDVSLPKEDTDAPSPRCKLRISNVDRTVINIMRSNTSPIDVEVTLVIASEPDDGIYGPAEFILTGCTYNVNNIEGFLTFNNVGEEQIPQWSFTPAHYPGLFG